MCACASHNCCACAHACHLALGHPCLSRVLVVVGSGLGKSSQVKFKKSQVKGVKSSQVKSRPSWWPLDSPLDSHVWRHAARGLYRHSSLPSLASRSVSKSPAGVCQSTPPCPPPAQPASARPAPMRVQTPTYVLTHLEWRSKSTSPPRPRARAAHMRRDASYARTRTRTRLC